jgi:hypothetical protein
MSYSPTTQVKDQDVARELDAISAAFASQLVFLRKYTSPPKNPADGLVVICDGVTWNPIGDGVRRPVWYDKEDNTWKTFA